MVKFWNDKWCGEEPLYFYFFSISMRFSLIKRSFGGGLMGSIKGEGSLASLFV